MTTKINGCITTISSRAKCLPFAIKSLWDNWNHRYDYPVYIHYFDDIYDSEEYRNSIRKHTSDNVHFISIPYKTPPFLHESELFYNRNLWYAQNRFSIARKGYLHMCHFKSNFYGYPGTEFQKYEYCLSIDDESLFLKDVPYNFFEEIEKREENYGALKIVDQHIKTPHQGNFDTRHNLWNFIKAYVQQYKVKPSSAFIRDLLDDPAADRNFHYYPISDTFVVKLKVFESPEWKQWIDAVNTFGGIYKYRWGDCEVHSIFNLLHAKEPAEATPTGTILSHIYDFKTVDEGYFNQGGTRHIQDYAPGVKDATR